MTLQSMFQCYFQEFEIGGGGVETNVWGGVCKHAKSAKLH